MTTALKAHLRLRTIIRVMVWICRHVIYFNSFWSSSLWEQNKHLSGQIDLKLGFKVQMLEGNCNMVYHGELSHRIISAQIGSYRENWMLRSPWGRKYYISAFCFPFTTAGSCKQLKQLIYKKNIKSQRLNYEPLSFPSASGHCVNCHICQLWEG